MSQQELLRRTITALEACDCDYMLTGSYASSFQGEPRLSHDVDIVVSLTEPGIKALLQAFPPPRFYLDELAVREAVRRHDMFNLLDADTGDKVDFWLLTDEEFDRSRFSRKVTEDLDGLPVKISTAEDTILMKLKWAADCGGSEKQFGDAVGVYELQADRLDHAYLDLWAERLGLTESLARLRQEAEPRS
jgi:hypothetical protein